MTGALDIAGFGSVAIDELVFVDALLSAGKGRVLRTEIGHGGNVATALVAAAALGARAGFVGWLSAHPEDAAAADSLASSGVDISRAVRAPDARPIRSTVVVGSDGERFIAYDDDTRVGAPPTLMAEDFQGARILLVDGYAAESLSAVSKAVKAGLVVVADIEWSSGASTDALTAQCHHLVLPWNYAACASGSEEPVRMLEALWSPVREAVVVTRGAAGAYLRYRANEQVWHQPAFDVEVIDTTGCGDWFHGAYATALARSMDPLEGLRFAAAAAGLAAGHAGGRGAMVTPEAVALMLESSGAPFASPVGHAVTANSAGDDGQSE